MKHMRFLATLLVAFLLFPPTAQAQDDIREAGEELAFAVKIMNEQCPMELGYGITLNSVRIEGSVVAYVCLIDEDVVSMDQIEASRDDIQANLEEYMAEASQDIAVQQFVKYCKAMEKDVVYRYIGATSAKIAEFFIEL